MKKQTKRWLVPCAAAVFTIGASMISFAATGWQEESGTWRYYGSDGTPVTETWKKSGNNWYWMDENGEMATSRLIEDDENHYYVDESGVQVKNQWRELDNEEKGDDEAETCWYYFGADGKAYRASNSGSTTFKSIKKADGVTKRYAFDENGRMLYGWVDDQSERLTDDDAWRTGIYYLGEAGDGALRAGEWAKLEVEDEENEDDDFQDWYWFYFKSNGKKTVDTTKKINGKKYRFEENGNAVFNWYATSSNTSATPGDMFYSQPQDSWLSLGWFKTVPGESVDPEGYESGEESWFYADKEGEIVKSQIKKINGNYYGFDEYGKMLDGLYKLSVNDKEIVSYEEIESESDLPDADEAWEVYYFGGMAKEGAMKTGSTTLEIDGEKYTYHFRKSGDDRGKGSNGIEDDIIYLKGQAQTADKDEKLRVVTWEDEDYLVNTSGKIQKKKNNAKDGDDRYYCTDSKGIVTYVGNEKKEKEKE
ncbi:MAG: cell wall-binding protein [Lachnospiraceae bacterium]|nr:cell wall-binding protein [Lachnospiraceae bacterium]